LTAFEQSSSRDSRNLSDDLFAGVCALRLEDKEKALGYMERVVESDIPLPDSLMIKYLASATMTITLHVTPRVEAQIPFDSLGAALILAELYQEADRRDEAIGILRQLAEEAPDDIVLKLSLCDLLYEDGSDDEVIELAAGVENDSEPALACLHLKGKALARRGLHSAALDTFSAGLRKTSGRNPELLKEIRYDRAALYEQMNQSKNARKDWERLYSDDPSYRDVRDRLSG
jgi:tetratricopeptide (TPR) repeat protein